MDTLNDNERINSIIRFELVKEYLEKAQVIVKKGKIQDRDEHVMKIKRSQELNPKEKSFCLEYLRELIVEMNYSQRTQITKDSRSDKYFVKVYTYEMKIVKRINRCIRCNSKQSDDEHCYCVVLYLLNNLKPSGYEFIDKFLSNYYMNQNLRSSAIENVIEWVPYECLKDVRYITKGRFGSLYSTTWTNGRIIGWDENNQQIIRTGPKIVALKLINELNEQDNKVLEEVISHIKFSSQGSHGVKCYGLTKFPDREKLGFLLDYMENGDLNNLLKRKDNNLTWKDRFTLLKEICWQLYQIHNNNMVHKNLHPGNILSNSQGWFISDFGFNGPLDGNVTNQIVGVLPFIAPEVLFGSEYTQASDIYSMGMIMWQLLARCYPFCNRKYDINLARDICNGLRPEITLDLPQDYQKIMKSCWDANPLERPTAEMLFQNFSINLEKISCDEYVIPELESMLNRSHFHVPNEISSITHEIVKLPEPKNKNK